MTITIALVPTSVVCLSALLTLIFGCAASAFFRRREAASLIIQAKAGSMAMPGRTELVRYSPGIEAPPTPTSIRRFIRSSKTSGSR